MIASSVFGLLLACTASARNIPVTLRGTWSTALPPQTSRDPSIPLVTSSGQTAAISSWHVQSTLHTGHPANLSWPGRADVSSWHYADVSRCTLLACLVADGTYSEHDLFYSDNLLHVDQSQFSVPWLYRHEFTLDAPEPGKHYFLKTGGITSRADIFLNGQQIANKDFQAGSYGGHVYDITTVAKASNALVVQAHPTDYNRDLAIGWVDWNPWPADHGTGVWRDITVKQAGAVLLGPLRIITDTGEPIGKHPAHVTLCTTGKNMEDETIIAIVEGRIREVDTKKDALVWRETIAIPPFSTVDIALNNTVDDPSIWWPAAWGAQPLYDGTLTVSLASTGRAPSISDTVTARFGIRTATIRLKGSDAAFFVNGLPFQVVGAGYSPDLLLRFEASRFEAQARYALDLGLNTIRLEGKGEQPELYDVADRLGLMILAGWECCDKWEAFAHNDHLPQKEEWTDSDYTDAAAAMAHEAAMLQTHPSVMGFLVGGDFEPNGRATSTYLAALRAANWSTAVISSAASRGHPKTPLGPSGMKMAGPYDWVPPNYWYDTRPADEEFRYGAAFGFGSEQGPGVGTPALTNLRKFLSPEDLASLWTDVEGNSTHMGRPGTEFASREVFNKALRGRWGKPGSLEEYVEYAQMMDYEATRAIFEGFAAMWSDPERPATGVIYWMLNSAWPSLHWSLWDYYMHPAGAFFGAKVAGRLEHVVYDPVHKDVYLINRALDREGPRTVEAEVIDLGGKVLVSTGNIDTWTTPNTSKRIPRIGRMLRSIHIHSVVLLRLVLRDDGGEVLSRNVYWIPRKIDQLDWADESLWYTTTVSEYADFRSLASLERAEVNVTVSAQDRSVVLTLVNQSPVPAFFISLTLCDDLGNAIGPVLWSDNYVTLWPNEQIELRGEVPRAGTDGKGEAGGEANGDVAGESQNEVGSSEARHFGSRRPTGFGLGSWAGVLLKLYAAKIIIGAR